MTKFMTLFAGISLAAIVSLAAAPGAEKPSGKMEIFLEKKDGAKVQSMDPGHVFKEGDLVRFRFRAAFPGFLYVMNQSSSGKYTLLFPKDETGRDNHVQAAKDYMIPATEKGWFRIEGPPGYETVYFLVAPASLGAAPEYVPLPPPPPATAAPFDVHPRCDDEIFKARGDCVDMDAGAQSLSAGDRLPQNFSDLPDTASRDIVVIRKPKSTVVSSAGLSAGPAIYTFRIAHK